jgi:hypothetical protein
VDKFLKETQRRILPRIESQALNKIAGTVRTKVAKDIREETSIRPQGVGRKFLKGGGGLVVTNKANPNNLRAIIRGNTRPTPLSKQFFNIGQRRASKRKASSTSVRLRGRRVVFKNSVLGTNNNIRARGRYTGAQFKFDDAATGPVVRLRTFSIRSQLEENYITSGLNEFAFKAFDKELKRLLKRKGFL